MAKYEQKFKMLAVRCLTNLKKEGSVEVYGITVFNVRQLVKALEISSYSLYKWEKEYTFEDMVPEWEDEDEDNYDDYDEDEDAMEDDFFWETTETELIVKEEDIPKDKVSFGIDFWMHVARNMGLKNYRTNLNQLKMRIGNELIKQSGLVRNGVREELRIK